MDIKSSLDKVMPIKLPVILQQLDLINIVSDKDKMNKIINENLLKYHNFIASQSKILFGLEFNNAMVIVSDFDNLNRQIEFSTDAFYESIKHNLNISLSLEAFDTLEDYHSSLLKEAKSKLELLKKVKTQSELKKKFPVLYRRFLSCTKEYYTFRKNKLEPLKKLNPFERYNKLLELELNFHDNIPNLGNMPLEDVLSYINNFNLNFFIRDASIALDNIIDNKDNIISYIHNNPINITSLSNNDLACLELYFAYCHLKQAQDADVIYKQDYLYYVSNYFKEHQDYLTSNLAITVGSSDGNSIRSGIMTTLVPKKSEGKVITPKILYAMYRDILIDNPNLRIIDFSNFDFTGMNLEEVANFMKNYLEDLQVNWEFLPPDDKKFTEDIIRHIKDTEFSQAKKTTPKADEKLLELFMLKKKLYDSTNPLFRIKGKNTFDGYIGYVYPNGRIVLDRFYDKQNDKLLADGQAVYAMNIEEFYELSKLSKSELIKNKLCRRYIHRGNWTEKVLKEEIKSESNTTSPILAKKYYGMQK